MYPNFSVFTSRAVAKAGEAARELDHHYAGTGHLVVGLIDVPECDAAQVLAEAGVTREAVVAILADRYEGRHGALPSNVAIYNTRASVLLQDLRWREPELVHSRDLLLAVLGEHDGLGAELLSELGLTEEFAVAALERIHAERAGAASSPTPPG